MYMTAINEVNRHIIYIIIRHCYFVENWHGVLWKFGHLKWYLHIFRITTQVHNLANRLPEIGRKAIMAAITEKLEIVNTLYLG